MLKKCLLVPIKHFNNFVEESNNESILMNVEESNIKSTNANMKLYSLTCKNYVSGRVVHLPLAQKHSVK